MSKIRLDQYLCQNGLVQSRERAKALIMSGIVFVNEQKADKAGEMIAPDAKVEVRGHDIGYVSRGGLKLEKAMQVFPMRPDGKVCMDIGASTGGFTDCMLQNGAVKVYAVDVGYGQLAWSLRTDERVVNMERTNIRNVKPEDLSELVAFFSVDVSFISLKHIFPVADTICTPEAVGVCLVKPQFEAGREKVGKKGVVRDPATHREVLKMAEGLYHINNVVEVNNLISISSGYAIGSYDLDQLQGQVVLACPPAGARYEGIGKGSLSIAHMPVLTDDLGPFGNPSSDSRRAMIQPGLRRVASVLYAFDGAEGLVPWMQAFEEALRTHCGVSSVTQQRIE